MGRNREAKKLTAAKKTQNSSMSLIHISLSLCTSRANKKEISIGQSKPIPTLQQHNPMPFSLGPLYIHIKQDHQKDRPHLKLASPEIITGGVEEEVGVDLGLVQEEFNYEDDVVEFDVLVGYLAAAILVMRVLERELM